MKKMWIDYSVFCGMYDINIYNGDCLEVMDLMIEDAYKFEMILCDLPYGTTECKWDKVIDLKVLFEKYKQLITDDGAIILFASQPFTTDLINAGRELFKYELIWDKIKPGGFVSAKLKPLKQHENILVFSKGVTANGSKRNMKYYPQMRKAEGKNIRPINNGSSLSEAVLNERKSMRIAKSDKDYDPTMRYPYSILKYGSQVGECNNSNRLHPTQKPVELLKYLIETYSKKGDKVLDNCIGSGSTAVACLETERGCQGIELDKKYFDLAGRRLTELMCDKRDKEFGYGKYANLFTNL